MKREPADLDYANVVKRASLLATRPENLLVLFFGAAVVALGSIFSLSLLLGPLGIGYAETCAKLTQGRRAILDDIVWRGIERLKPSVLLAGVILALAILSGLFMLVVPGMFALLFSGLVFSALARAKEPLGGLDAIQNIWSLVSRRPVPLILMGLIASLIAVVLNLAGYMTSWLVFGLTALATLEFFFLVSSLVYQHYFEPVPLAGQS